MHDTHLTITALILLLLIASGVAMITKWVPVPYTVALVVVGLVTSQLHFLPTIHISPELILLIFLPALLFEASWNLNLKSLRENLTPILWLSVVGVTISVGVIGAILHYGVGLSWSLALLFGASRIRPVLFFFTYWSFGNSLCVGPFLEGMSRLRRSIFSQ